MSRSGGPQIKNRAPAAIQITAEQLLREARERGFNLVNFSVYISYFSPAMSFRPR